jgi:hypothetical protein
MKKVDLSDLKQIHVFRSRYGHKIELEGSFEWAKERAGKLGMHQFVITKNVKNENSNVRP